MCARILRRDFIKNTIAGGIGVAVLPDLTEAQTAGQTETRYVAAYDTESPACLAACRKIVEVHKRFEMPATFFIVGRTLDANPAEYRKLLDDPLFEIASHTYSHRMLRDNDFCGSAVSMDERRKEIFKGKEAVETNKSFISLIWHPWSLAKFDPDMKMLEFTFTHVRRLKMKTSTYAQLYEDVSARCFISLMVNNQLLRSAPVARLRRKGRNVSFS